MYDRAPLVCPLCIQNRHWMWRKNRKIRILKLYTHGDHLCKCHLLLVSIRVCVVVDFPNSFSVVCFTETFKFFHDNTSSPCACFFGSWVSPVPSQSFHMSLYRKSNFFCFRKGKIAKKKFFLFNTSTLPSRHKPSVTCAHSLATRPWRLGLVAGTSERFVKKTKTNDRRLTKTGKSLQRVCSGPDGLRPEKLNVQQKERV